MHKELALFHLNAILYGYRSREMTPEQGIYHLAKLLESAGGGPFAVIEVMQQLGPQANAAVAVLMSEIDEDLASLQPSQGCNMTNKERLLKRISEQRQYMTELFQRNLDGNLTLRRTHEIYASAEGVLTRLEREYAGILSEENLLAEGL